jgi:inorganic triphosphatase YgiF
MVPAVPPAGAPGSEFEVKLALAPNQLNRLRRHPIFAGTRTRSHLIASTYFDTPDFALRRRALALRVRKEGRRYVQTLKGHDVAGATQRPEWQAFVAGPAPDLSHPGLHEQLGDLDGQSLQPIFVSRIRRSTRLVRPDPATVVEVSCDQGAIETPDGTSVPVCEVELELKEGAPEVLFEMARTLNRSTPLRVETRSKAARGYALATGGEHAQDVMTQRYGKIDLRRDMPAEQALASILRHCLRHLLANDQAALKGDAEGVHQMRVALRRLRATLSLFKAMIPSEQREWATREIKWVAAALGDARNWDVFATYVAPIEEVFVADHQVARLHESVQAKRSAAYDCMRTALQSSRYTDLVLQLMTWIETRGWRQQTVSEASVQLLAPVGELADALLERHYRKSRKLAKRFVELAPSDRHRLRISLKKLRYAVDSLQRIYDAKSVRRQLKRLSALQDDLGTLNDVAMLDALLSELPGSAADDGVTARAPALIQGWYGRVRTETEAEIGKKLGRFGKMKPFWRPAGA